MISNRILCVGVGGAIGALCRYWLQGWVHDRWGSSFPSGTMIVNISGCFLIGLLMTIFLEHVEIAPTWRLFLVAGILGGYTTFSSYMWESFQLLTLGSIGWGFLYLLGSVVGGFLGLFIGVVIGRVI